MRSVYPKEMYDFISGNVDQYTNEQLAKLVSDEFNMDMSEAKIKSYLSNHKIKRIVKLRKPPSNRLFTDEMEQFIRDNIKGCPIEKFAEILNARFGTNIKYITLKCFCTRNGIRNGCVSKFSKGNIPHNKGKKGYYSPGSEKGWFKKGHKTHNYVVPGTVVITSDGYFAKKIADPHKWEQLSIHLWKEAGRELPEGSRLIYKDGNPLNCTLENLMTVSMQHHLALNRNGFRSADPDITETRVNLLKLNDVIREKENGKKRDRKKESGNI